MWNTFVLLLLCALATALGVCQAVEDGVINVVLIGATGNLAQKYLWQSLRNIDAEGKTTALKIWPAGTRAGMQGAIDSILTNNVTYAGKDKTHFASKVGPYSRLAESADYSLLNQAITKSNGNRREVGRIVYLSVPPKFFGNIASEINKALRPANAQDTWLKVIVEKPFGVDLNSALQLSRDLFASLAEQEVLCVDHYMGKDTLRAIREFRELNPDYISHEFVSKLANVQVQMVETEDCATRTGFYSEVGVMRDTMQNHLMMMLSLFTMELDKQVDESLRRNQAVQRVYGGRIVNLGQYSTYKTHEREDYLAYHGKEIAQSSNVPTYAEVELKFKSASPYANVPFIFTSGKALAKRRAFLRANLRNGGGALTFMVQGELDGISGPAIHATSALQAFARCPAGWTREQDGHLCRGPANSPNAYQVLLNDLLLGDFASFVSIPEVLQSWRIWTSLVESQTSDSYLPGGSGLLDDLNNGSEASKAAARQEL